MEKWLTEFFDNMRYIWGEFAHEVNSIKIDADTVTQYVHGTEYSAEWHATPNVDPRKAVNNIDNLYIR